MSDWSSVTTFGRPDSTLPLCVRPSAYAILNNSSGQVVLVQTSKGYYLPGGGANPGETVETTVQREVDEETCLHIAIGKWRRQAIDHIAVIDEGASFEKRSTFCDAILIRHTERVAESGHTIVWATPDEAVVRLTPESHRWAVVEWLADRASEQWPSRPAV